MDPCSYQANQKQYNQPKTKQKVKWGKMSYTVHAVQFALENVYQNDTKYVYKCIVESLPVQHSELA